MHGRVCIESDWVSWYSMAVIITSHEMIFVPSLPFGNNKKTLKAAHRFFFSLTPKLSDST